MTKNIRRGELNYVKLLKDKNSLLDALTGMSPDGYAYLKGLLNYTGSSSWEGIKAVPPGSFLEDIIELFRCQTDIPLELPLVAVLCHVSGFLNAVGAQYEIGGSLQAPRLWIIALASSGSGKSYAIKTVGRWLSDASGNDAVPQLSGASSAAQFVANVAQCPRGIWFRDEFGQFMSQVQNLQYMEEIKDILLRAYSGDPIERKTKEVQIEVREHALTILGVTVEDTFEKQIGAESLVDGFAQRFNYIHAKADPERPLSKFPIYFENMDSPEIQVPFQRLRKTWLHLIGRNDLPDAVFRFDEDALQLFKVNFRSLFEEANIPASFFRRAMFSVFSYAVVFHVIAGRMGTTVGTESVSLALRMVALHLDHARQLLDGYGLSELEKVVRKVEVLQKRYVTQGRELKARDIISGVREIKTAGQAYSILDLLNG
ncbi:DUF3987 domain-containing protein [Paracoccus aerius]|uniref:DUF3987 domain-containing protein n=1 Tax=Paracoccus aerius TaxID=1915382 RepID=A0ABS1SAW8_9RHOB|nr:DUF3987 domain-containing protein [Paracoccus aerius]MBL3675689.1 DUF3987 domain-containing protein [Paracoccus aerius]GHG36440.1 hypothetical protein GCM10017322_39120 [Paracoccus aerius]